MYLVPTIVIIAVGMIIDVAIHIDVLFCDSVMDWRVAAPTVAVTPFTVAIGAPWAPGAIAFIVPVR